MKTVVAAPFSAEWSGGFGKIRSELETVFPVESTRIEYIGSTSVEGLAAKPIIDVLLGAESLALVECKMGLSLSLAMSTLQSMKLSCQYVAILFARLRATTFGFTSTQ